MAVIIDGTTGISTPGVTDTGNLSVSGTTTLTTPLPVASGGTGGSATPTAGGVVYGTGSAQAVTAAGTSGQFLQSNGTSAPTWTTPSSGALVFLSTVTASNSATVSLETTFSSTYDSYLIIFSNVAPSVDGSNMRVLLKINGTYQTSGYNYHAGTTQNTSSAYAGQGGSAQSSIGLQGGIGTDSRATTPGSTYDCHVRINAPTNTTTIKTISWNGSTAGLTNAALFGSGQFVTSFEALTGVRFQYGSGNIVTGTFRLYGIANS
jgi:hypothetical protein